MSSLLYCTHAQIVVISMVVAFTKEISNTRTKSKMEHDVDGIVLESKTYILKAHMRNVELTIIVYMQL
jgi:hypothetical protein